MMAKTHMVGGTMAALAWYMVAPPQSVAEAGVIMGGCLAGSLIPDLDHPESKLSRTNIITRALSGIMTIPSWGKHRRFWHSIWAFIVFGIAGFALTFLCSEGLVYLFDYLPADIPKFDITQYAFLVGLSFFVGAFSHGVMDTLTIQGNQWLYPIKFQLRLLPIQTGSPLETLFMVACSVVTAGMCLTLLKMGVAEEMLPRSALEVFGR